MAHRNQPARRLIVSETILLGDGRSQFGKTFLRMPFTNQDLPFDHVRGNSQNSLG